MKLLARLKEILKVISVGVEDKKFSKRRRHDVLLVFWLGALEFQILKFLFFCCLNMFMNQKYEFSEFPWHIKGIFSYHKTIKQ